MLFSINQSPNQLWQQKQQLLAQLSNFSNQSVLDPIEDKQCFHQQITAFIHQQFFDSALGGLIQQENGQYKKPIVANLYLSEILIAADRVFYDGDFSHLANNINDYFYHNKLFSEPVPIEHLDGFIITDILNHLLNAEELLLLNSLVTPSNGQLKEKTEPDGMVINYCRSLRSAAENINMHFKQAQIVEQALIMKVAEYLHLENSKIKGYQPLNFNQNCQLMISMSHYCLLKSNSTLQQYIFEHYEELLDQELLDNQEDAQEAIIRLVFSGINLLQLEFNLTIVRQLEQWLARNVSNGKALVLNDELKYQFDVVISFFNSIKKLNLNSIELTLISDSYNVENNITIRFFEKNDPRTSDAIVNLRSSYYPNQLIFSY